MSQGTRCEIIQVRRIHNKMGVRWCSLGWACNTVYPSGTLFSFPARFSQDHAMPPNTHYACYIFLLGRRHVRANIVAYAYLYRIKKSPFLKMHRPFRRATSTRFFSSYTPETASFQNWSKQENKRENCFNNIIYSILAFYLLFWLFA